MVGVGEIDALVVPDRRALRLLRLGSRGLRPGRLRIALGRANLRLSTSALAEGPGRPMKRAVVGFCVGWACCHCYLSYRYHFRPWNSIPWGGAL